jgi:hypothetical protein
MLIQVAYTRPELTYLDFQIVYALLLLFWAKITHIGSTPIFPSGSVAVAIYAGQHNA